MGGGKIFDANQSIANALYSHRRALCCVINYLLFKGSKWIAVHTPPASVECRGGADEMYKKGPHQKEKKKKNKKKKKSLQQPHSRRTQRRDFFSGQRGGGGGDYMYPPLTHRIKTLRKPFRAR